MNKVRAINNFFKNATKSQIEQARAEIILSDRQDKIFQMFYIQKLDIGFIVDTLCVCPRVIGNELCIIREKLYKLSFIFNA